MSIRLISQLELEGFAQTVQDAYEAGTGAPLSVAEIKLRSMAARQALDLKISSKEEREINAEIPDWFDQYHRLLNAGLPWRIAAFVAWATLPRHSRWPRTQDELAREVLGLGSDRVIAEWRKKYPIDQMIADLQAESLMAFRPGAFHALGTMASQLSYRAAPDRKLFFEMTRDYTPRQKIETERMATDDLSELSDAELDALDGVSAKEMLKRIRDDATLTTSAETGAEDGDVE